MKTVKSSGSSIYTNLSFKQIWGYANSFGITKLNVHNTLIKT